MANSTKVIPIRPDIFTSLQQREIAKLAYEYWLARFGVQYGSPEYDLYRARREVMVGISKSRDTTAGPFLVRKPGS